MASKQRLKWGWLPSKRSWKTGWLPSRNRMSTLEEKLEGRMDLIDNRLGAVERGLAKLEGLMVGMRDALFGTRRAANS